MSCSESYYESISWFMLLPKTKLFCHNDITIILSYYYPARCYYLPYIRKSIFNSKRWFSVILRLSISFAFSSIGV